MTVPTVLATAASTVKVRTTVVLEVAAFPFKPTEVNVTEVANDPVMQARAMRANRSEDLDIATRCEM